jgi:gas vesicle protein
MSERSGGGGGGGGFGAFLFGIVLGAVAGFVFAPTEGGESTRRKVTKGLRNLKELAEEKVDDVRGLLQEAEAEAAESDDEDEAEEPEIATREQLRRRLEAARRRRARARPPVPRASEEEDEPLA